MCFDDPELIQQIRASLDQFSVVVVIDQHGAILGANATAARVLKSPSPALVGQALAQFESESAEKLTEMLAALKASTAWRGELEFLGTWLSAQIVPLAPLARFKRNAAFLLTGFEISDLKQRELALKSANEGLEHFAYVAAHDLHEPLRKIRAFSERLTSKFAALFPPEAHDYLSRMHAAAGRMQDLIDDLLAYSRITHNQDPFEIVDLNQTIMNVLADLELQIESLHQDHVVSVGTLPKIKGDASEMHRLFQNLLANALKFRVPDRAVAISIAARDEGDEHVISVTDNGIGFAPEDAERIFFGFNRLHTQREFPGTGIGLSICRRIVEHHNGKISAQSRPGQGAEFEIRLPSAIKSGATA